MCKKCNNLKTLESCCKICRVIINCKIFQTIIFTVQLSNQKCDLNSCSISKSIIYYQTSYYDFWMVKHFVLVPQYSRFQLSKIHCTTLFNSFFTCYIMLVFHYLGHRWTEVSIRNMTAPLRWRQITAEGVFEEKGSLWLLSTSNELFHLRPNSENLNVSKLHILSDIGIHYVYTFLGLLWI